MTNLSVPGSQYWAFISYSSKDAAHARWLHRAIETYGIPARLVAHGHRTPTGDPAPKRLQPVFRDRDELPASADLGQTIGEALAASRYLIVVCSPNAARSQWVNREIEAFAEMGRRDRIFAFVVGGEPNSGDEQECFPPALRRQEPLAADARPQGDGRSDARLKLLAGMLGVGFDALKQREAQRRIRRLELGIAATLALVLAFAGLAWVANRERSRAIVAEANAVAEAHTRATAEAEAVAEAHARATAQAVADEQRAIAVQQKDEAERQARLALSGQLASESRVYLGESPDLSLLFAAESLATYDTFQARSALLSGLLQSPHLDRILRTPENATALAFSPDGSTLAAAACTSRDASQECLESSLHFWDRVAGRPVGSPVPALPGLSWALTYAPDGQTLYVGGAHGAILEWDVASGGAGAQYTLNRNTVTALAVSPDGQTLAAGNCYALSSPGGLCERGALGVWDLAAREPVSTTLEGQSPTGRGLAFSPDGQFLLAADCARVEPDTRGVDRCVQGEVRRWRLPGGEAEVYPVAASTSGILAVAFAPDGKTLFASEASGAIHRLDPVTLEPVGAPLKVQGLSPEGLWAGPQPGDLLIADVPGQAALVRRLGASSAPFGLAAREGAVYYYGIALSPGGETLATSTCPGGAGASYPCPAGSEIQLWDLVLWHPAEQVLRLEQPQALEIALPAGPAGPTALVHAAGQVRRLDLVSGQPAGEVLFEGDEALLSVRLSPDGTRAATIDCVQRDPAFKIPFCVKTEIRFWDTAVWQPAGEPARVSAWVQNTQFSPDGAYLAADGPDDTVAVLDTATGAQVQAITTGIGPGFRELSFAAGAQALAVSGCLPAEGNPLCQENDVVRVFDLATGAQIGTEIGPFDATVTALTMGPAGRESLVAVALYAFSGQEWGVWDWQTGASVSERLPGRVLALAFSPDGRLLAATGRESANSSSNCLTRLWDLEQGQMLGAPLVSDLCGSRQLAFSPEGTRLAANSGAALIFWSLDPAGWQERACRAANRNLSAEEWSTYVGEAPYHKTCPDLP